MEHGREKRKTQNATERIQKKERRIGRNHGFHRWTRIKSTKSNDPTGLGQEKDDGDLPENNRHVNGSLLEEDRDSEINESFNALLVSVLPSRRSIVDT